METLLQPLFTMSLGELLLSVLQIALIDLVLSGDNAAVIGMAICRLPEEQKRRAAALGALLAICLRTAFTLAATLLLDIPFLSAGGGLVLLFITFRLLFPSHEDENIATVNARSRLWQAVGVIIAADASMALDNVLGVAGAAQGKPLLVCFGLLLSVPLLVWGASFIAGLMQRFPLIIWLGGAILTHTALHMILSDSGLLFLSMPESMEQTLTWAAGAAVLILGIWEIYGRHRQ